jgi:DMSO reductase anchor subunit
MAVMYAVTYLNTAELAHVRWSEHRLFMVMLMGATMTVVMLGFMLTMYRNWKANAAILTAAVALFALGLLLVRSETTVQDRSYMSAMIPHHSIAILTSERSEIADVRVCELAVEIIEAQRREIDEMDWLIDDIGRNGIAATAAEADARPVPEFSETSQRTCQPG